MLEDKLLSDYGSAYLKQISNPEATTATTITDTTPRLISACNASRGHFSKKVGQTLDESDANVDSYEQLAIAMDLACYFLRDRRGNSVESLREELAALDERLFNYAKTQQGEGWVAPTTNSQLAPTREGGASGESVLPWMDNARFRKVEPTWNRSTSDADDQDDVVGQ